MHVQEEEPREDTVRRWLSVRQGERLPKNPHLLAPGLCTVSLQSCEKYTLITQVMQSMAFYYGSPSNSHRKGIRKPPGGLSGSWPALGSSCTVPTRWQHILEGRLGVQAGQGMEAQPRVLSTPGLQRLPSDP